ncbi:hydrophobic surface binding protein A-domain-containing protein [Thelonectria olida]|uniref:Hydrophobic surface binding protein A-domain-containing protein n=1 Tax=Thelonectria olida TaxID=1576542 RepID=A0A9P8WCA9_9HYPO|nr:hydrophobic surface binding protein A-domain-containing protein [Thelonectria olida]
MLLSRVLTLAGLASTAVASGATIIAAMDSISNSTKALNKTIASWDGRVLGVCGITVKSTQLLLDIKNGTEVAHASANLTFNEAVQVASATTSLATVVNSTLTTIIKAKSKFDKLLLTPVIHVTLELQKNATDEFSAAVIEKVPKSLQGTAKGLVKPIAEAFDKAIKKYSSTKK